MGVAMVTNKHPVLVMPMADAPIFDTFRSAYPTFYTGFSLTHRVCF